MCSPAFPTLKSLRGRPAFALKGKSLSIAEIGQQLNVRTVLEGSVRRVNQRVRITAQLINTADGYHLWSERYDREVEDVFAIQDEIARTIVERLKVKLTNEQDQALGRRQTENIEAYELYLRGRHCSYRWNISGMMQKALEYFEAALVKDPDYALAYHGLADVYSILGLYAFQPPAAVVEKAMTAATRAVDLAPELAETRTPWVCAAPGLGLEGGEVFLLHAIELTRDTLRLTLFTPGCSALWTSQRRPPSRFASANPWIPSYRRPTASLDSLRTMDAGTTKRFGNQSAHSKGMPRRPSHCFASAWRTERRARTRRR